MLTRLTARGFGALVAAAAVMGTAAAAASASSIVYVNHDNVYEISPDGAAQRQLSSNGVANGGYFTPTEADNGVVVAVYQTNTDGMFISWKPDGSYMGAASTDPGGGVGNSVPLTADVDPGDGLIGYGYVYFGGPADGYNTYPQVDFQNPNAAYTSGQFPAYPGYLSPRYLFSTGTFGLIPDGASEIDAQQPPSGPVPWITLPSGYTVDSFDESRTVPHQVLVEYDSGGGHYLAVFQENAPPPGPVTLLCSGYPLSAPSVGNSSPRWSPDGTQIVFSDVQGVEVSPAPVNSSGSCSLSPKLLVAGGSEADWGPASLPAPAQPGGGGGGGGGGATGSGAPVTPASPGATSTTVCRVPNVLGRRLRAAKRAIRSAHCTVGAVRTRHTPRRLRGKVKAESPGPGAIRGAGARVNLVVGR